MIPDGKVEYKPFCFAYGEADVQPSLLPAYFITGYPICQYIFSGKINYFFAEDTGFCISFPATEYLMMGLGRIIPEDPRSFPARRKKRTKLPPGYRDPGPVPRFGHGGPGRRFR